MFRLALKGILARKGRLLLTSLAVILGTSFLAGTYIFSDTLTKSFNDLFSDVFDDTDAFVRSSVVIEGDFGAEERQRIPESLTAVVAEVPGVRTAVPSVLGFARVIGKDGEPIGAEGNGPPNFGSSIVAEADGETFWRITEGRLPENGTEVALDTSTAENGDYQVGDTVKVVAQAGSREFTLVGVARYGDVSSPGGATFALFDLATAQEFVGKPGFIDAVVVTSDGSKTDAELADAIQAALPPDSQTETLTGAEITEENQNAIEDALSFFRIFLTVFSFIAMGVACFVIYNVFSITAAQRQRENALLRGSRRTARPGDAGDVDRVRGSRHRRFAVGNRRRHRRVDRAQGIPRSARCRLPVDGIATASTHHRADAHRGHAGHSPVGGHARAANRTSFALGGDARVCSRDRRQQPQTDSQWGGRGDRRSSRSDCLTRRC